jgi:hypothetical protein
MGYTRKEPRQFSDNGKDQAKKFAIHNGSHVDMPAIPREKLLPVINNRERAEMDSASGADASRWPEDRPGDPACLLRRVCQNCGSVADEDPPTTCQQCHADMPAD